MVNFSTFVNKDEITRKDFDEIVKSYNLEVYTAENISKYIESITSLIEKSENGEELSQEEKSNIDIAKAEIGNLRKCIVLDVVDGQIVKVPLYVQESMVDIEKGVYVDNSVNRKLGRVGRQWGGKKEEGEEGGLSKYRDHLKKVAKEKGDKDLADYADKATIESLKKRWLSDNEYRSNIENNKQGKRESEKKMEEMSDSERKEYLKTSSKELLGRMDKYLDSKKENKSEEKKEKYSKDEISTFNEIREWSGDEYKDEHIKSILDQLKEADITNADLHVSKKGGQEKYYENVHNKVKELKNNLRPGLVHKDIRNKGVDDILWGLVMSKNS